jgi:hypothetical protein
MKFSVVFKTKFKFLPIVSSMAALAIAAESPQRAEAVMRSAE